MSKTYSVSFYTLGCRLNQAETAMFCDAFRKRGYDIREFGEPTEVCVVNTCSVTAHSEARCRNMIRNVLRKHPETFMVVVGCYAEVGLEAIQAIPGVDMIVGTEQKFEVAARVEAWRASHNGDGLRKCREPIVVHAQMSQAEFTLPAVGDFFDHTRANIKIQDGCDFFCSYCIVPYTRGRDRSREFDDIHKEALQLARRGHREIVITGVNIGTYAYQGKNLLDVVKMFEDLDGVERVRLTSIEPMTIPPGMVEYLASSRKLCHFFHVPIQSGDNTILTRMNRRYTREDFDEFVLRLAACVPDAGMGTDIIVGFPGEGDQEFEHSRQVLEDLPLMYAHVFSFSPRRGTPAAKLPGRVPAETIKQRSEILRQLSAEKRRRFYQTYIGQTVSVLFEQRERNGLFTGYTGNYMKVGVSTPRDLSNTMCDVLITEIRDKLAIGRMNA